MTIIAFDVSKSELIGVRIDRNAGVKEEYAIPNTPSAIEIFLNDSLSKYRRLLIGSEATAEYHRPLALACLKREIPFKLINPLITKQFTRVTVRKKKTDQSDALVIAKCLLQGQGTLVGAETFSPAKVLNRTAVKLSHIAGMLLRLEQHLQATDCQSPIAGELTGLREKTEICMTLTQTQARQTLDPHLLKLLQSIPGIGPTLATAFISELAPIKRFFGQKALIAYAGLDPRVKQSGASLKRNTHLTKRGSAILRRAAYLAASIAQRKDPELKVYYEKKRAEGKRYREATIANARHILYRIYAVWKRNTPYVEKSTVIA